MRQVYRVPQSELILSRYRINADETEIIRQDNGAHSLVTAPALIRRANAEHDSRGIHRSKNPPRRCQRLHEPLKAPLTPPRRAIDGIGLYGCKSTMVIYIK